MKITRVMLLSCLFFTISANELQSLQNLKDAVIIDEATFSELALHAKSESVSHDVQYDYNIPLYRFYPALQENMVHISLGSFPTPIQELATLQEMYNIQNLFIKQDSECGGVSCDGEQLFGGNKVRKLEFLLADALRCNAESVLTFGCIGSNHATATATYAKHLGLRCYCMLTPQPNSSVVQRNLALMNAADANIIRSVNGAYRVGDTVATFMQSKTMYGDYPYFIRTGGSTPIGVVGFVNAAFELREQIHNGILPTPDYIYVAAGSFGTVAGLSLGCKAAGIESRIIAVCVEPEEIAGAVERRINELFMQTNELLHGYDATFPLFDEVGDNVIIVHDFSGTQYGLCTREAFTAMEDAHNYENICLDGTYTGKAFSALLAHAQQGMLRDKSVLFWNTFCSDVH